MDDQPQLKLQEDTADVFAALVNIWLALDAIKATLPEPQAKTVSFAVDGLAKIMGSLMNRHNIEVSSDAPKVPS